MSRLKKFKSHTAKVYTDLIFGKFKNSNKMELKPHTADYNIKKNTVN